MVFEYYIKKFQEYARIAEEVKYSSLDWAKPIFEKQLETYGQFVDIVEGLEKTVEDEKTAKITKWQIKRRLPKIYKEMDKLAGALDKVYNSIKKLKNI